MPRLFNGHLGNYEESQHLISHAKLPTLPLTQTQYENDIITVSYLSK